MTGWLTIDTAPQDGRHILALIEGRSFGYIAFQQAPEVQTVVHWWDKPGEAGWYTSVNELAPERPFPATHWKPLERLEHVPGLDEAVAAARIAEAFRKGAMAALGCASWEDADDFFSLVGMEYARGNQLPPTMPKPVA